MKAANSMTRDVFFVHRDDDLATCWTMMRKLAIRHLPVLDNGDLVGIISDRDVLANGRVVAGGFEVPSVPVERVMTHPVVTCVPGDTLSAVGAQMLRHKIDSVVVVDETGDLVGLITSTDFIHLVLEAEAIQRRASDPFEFRVAHLAKAAF